MADGLWTCETAARATGGQAQGRWQVRGLSLDSRTLKPGEMFVAIKDRRDGHRFVPGAIAAGAGSVMVSGPVDQTIPALIVDDTLAALERLAAAGRDRCAGLRVGVTGSAGKTSVKDMLAQVFKAAGRAHWSQKSFNNQWGVPLSLAVMPPLAERAIFEIGMNTPGEIAPRAHLIAPHMAAVTCIANAHLEGLGSLDNVAAEKAQIFAGLASGGTALIPGNDRFADYLEARAGHFCPDAEIMRFGTDSEHVARLADMTAKPDGMLCHLTIDGQSVRVRLRAHGEHWGLNTALVSALAYRSGIALPDIADSLDGFEPPPGRGRAEIVSLAAGGEAILLDDAYNANPHSMRAALSSLRFYSGRKLAALGAMQELGADSEALHIDLATPIKEAGVSQLFLIGDEMHRLATALADSGIKLFQTSKTDSLVHAITESLLPGDTLLVKGSNASGMAHIAEAIRCGADRIDGECRHGS